jgi:two-component system response regulator AtoC
MKILVIDDEVSLAELLVERLEKAGYLAQAAYRGADGLRAAETFKPEIILSDHFLPDTSGLELLPQLKALLPDSPVIMMTGAGNSKLAVQAMKLGAEDYLEKPINFDELQILLERLAGQREIKEELTAIKLSRRDEAVQELNVIAGASMQAIYDEIERVAAMDRVTVLISGETGTGKEHAAKLLHRLSKRAGRPFIEFNCAAFPENLVESELFGFEAGAFTDARKQKRGLLESGQGGTVFFDEVGELSLPVQAKLLKVLEDRESRRVGSLVSLPLDIRIVAASNRDLSKEVADGRFRADLFYRLNVFPLRLPPLRERVSDIRRLAQFFFEKSCLEFGRKLQPLPEAALEMLEAHAWPGNVRELRNVIDGLVIRSLGKGIAPEELGRSLGSAVIPEFQAGPGAEPAEPDPSEPSFPGLKEVLDRSARSLKRRMILAALEKTGGNKSEAARMLQVDYKTLYNLVKELDINLKVSYESAESVES